MLIFNTTYKVATNQNENWLEWMNNQHIPFMLESGLFSKPQIAKVLGSEDNEGLSFSVQFLIQDIDSLMDWHRENAVSFQNNCSAKFGTEVVFFTTVLELID